MFAICAQAIACHDTVGGEKRWSQLRAKKKYIASFEKAAFTHEFRGLIGQQLKVHYDLAEPIPDRLADLLKQLAQQIDERDSESGYDARGTRLSSMGGGSFLERVGISATAKCRQPTGLLRPASARCK